MSFDYPIIPYLGRGFSFPVELTLNNELVAPTGQKYLQNGLRIIMAHTTAANAINMIIGEPVSVSFSVS
jgi:hypothetical protein